MKVINVYEQYFSADCTFNGVPRKAVNVRLTATSDQGQIFYEASVSFFPHRDEEDFAISYDACAEKELFCGKGRRTKKRDGEFLASLRRPVQNPLARPR